MNPIPPSDSEKTIFARALALPDAERSGYLDLACGGNGDLRRGVEELLRAVNAVGFMAAPAAGFVATERATKQPEETLGKFIGHYKLLQRIGEGGCGTVYMAEQEEPVRRRVALKVIKLGMDTKEVITRFEAERQALAMMDHPNIAKVLEAGATETGRPFFAMELVRGVPITKYCDEQRLSTSARLGLFTQVCHAVQHAHQKGIIHRDLKPSNILVTLHDGVPIPKVIDFGIAKATHGRLTDNTLFTAFEQFVGTPAYMSPEQAEMSSLDIDTRSDIYSLGVLLYELLTGRTPFEGKELLQAGLDEMRRQIREVEPPRPSSRLETLEKATLTTTAQHRHTDAMNLVSLVGGDLDWIVMRCLEKDRTRRYDTANSLADDIGRHLGNEPVTARPPSTAYRLSKAIRRNKVAFGAGAAVAAALAIGLIVSTTLYLREKAAREFAIGAAVAQRDLSQELMSKAADNQTLLRESTLSEKKAAIEATRNAYALPLLKETFKGIASASIPTTGRAQLIQTLDQAADRLNHDSAMPPEAKSDLYDTLGDAYMALGEFGRAEQKYRELLALRRKLFGVMHEETAVALNKLIEALKRQGKSAEAEAEQNASKVMQSDFLRTDSGGTYLRVAGLELLRQGKYTEAEARLREAREVNKSLYRGWAWGGLFDAEIALARFQTGDFPGAKELAIESLRVDQEQEWWHLIIDPIRRTGHFDWGSTKAKLLLGRIALRDGNLVAAKNYLLSASVQPGNGQYAWSTGEFDFGLPTELWEAGEREAVIQFVDSLKNNWDDWNTRYKWKTMTLYESIIWERAYYDQWRKDLSAGRVPDYWKKRLLPPPPIASSASLKSLPPPQSKSPLGREVSFLLTQLQYPLCIQILGCVLAIPILHRRPRVFEGLSLRIVSWLSAFGVLCIVEGSLLLALFWRTYLSFPLVFSQEIYALAAGTVLWEIRRAFRGETTVGSATLLLRGSLFYLAVFFCLKAALTNERGDAPEFVYFMTVFAGPLLWAISIGIILSVAWELVRWIKHNGPLLSRTKFFLYFAAPLLCAQAVTTSWPILVGFNFISRPVAVAFLWLNVLLPWLMICGFAAIEKQAGKPGASPLAPVQ